MKHLFIYNGESFEYETAGDIAEYLQDHHIPFAVYMDVQMEIARRMLLEADHISAQHILVLLCQCRSYMK